MLSGFHDLLAWLFGWKSAAAVTGPYSVQAGQLHAAGAVAGQLFLAQAAAGEVFTPTAAIGQTQG